MAWDKYRHICDSASLTPRNLAWLSWISVCVVKAAMDSLYHALLIIFHSARELLA